VRTGEVRSLDELIENGVIELTRGKVISRKDIDSCPGHFPIYSSAKENEGKFGEYGRYMFDEDLITWSVDGGGMPFYRPRHKFSVTNVGGVLRIKDQGVLDYQFLHYVLLLRHSETKFDWVRKAHPSVIRKLYRDIPILPLAEQQRIVAILDEAFAGLATATANAKKNVKNARELFDSYLNSVFEGAGGDWQETSLGSEIDLLVGFAFKSAQYTKSESGVRLLRGDNVIQNALRWDDAKRWPASDIKQYEAYELEVGDIERWSRFAGQAGGLAKVDSGLDYAANFSSFACVA